MDIAKVVGLNNLKTFYAELKKKFAPKQLDSIVDETGNPVLDSNGNPQYYEYITTKNGYTAEQIDDRLSDISLPEGSHYLRSDTGTKGYTQEEVNNNFMPQLLGRSYLICTNTDTDPENPKQITVQGYNKTEIDNKCVAKSDEFYYLTNTNGDKGYTQTEVDQKLEDLVSNQNNWIQGLRLVTDLSSIDYNNFLYFYTINEADYYPLLPDDFESLQSKYGEQLKIYSHNCLTYGVNPNYINSNIVKTVQGLINQDKMILATTDLFPTVENIPSYLNFIEINSDTNEATIITNPTEIFNKLPTNNIYVYQGTILNIMDSVQNIVNNNTQDAINNYINQYVLYNNNDYNFYTYPDYIPYFTLDEKGNYNKITSAQAKILGKTNDIYTTQLILYTVNDLENIIEVEVNNKIEEKIRSMVKPYSLE